MVDCIEALERPQKLGNSGALSAAEFYQQYFRVLSEVDTRPNVISAAPHFEENQDTTHYAGFWRRGVAFLIDSIIVISIGCIGGSFIGLVYGLLATAVPAGDIGSESIIIEAGVLGVIWGIAADCLYFTTLESSSMQATPGKVVLNLIVTNYEFKRIGFRQANVRYWGKFASSLILCIGFLMVAFTERKQALHDQLAGTLVIVKRH